MPLQAGAAVRDVSPTDSRFLVGYPHVDRMSTGIHDPLLASALCLRNETTGVVLVAVDILFLPPETAREVRAAIAARAGVPETNVFVSCTHTHSGPVTNRMLSWKNDPVVRSVDPAYLEHLKAGIVEAAAEASDNVRPAEIAWTQAAVDGVGCNRLSPDGPRDPEAGLLVARDAGSKDILAVMSIYGTHPTVMHEDSTLVSSDFPHYARVRLREAFGEDVIAVYHNGLSGNLSPRYHVKAQTFAEAERLGRRLGDFFVEAINALDEADYAADAVLGGVIERVDLPPRRLPSLAEAEKNLQQCVETFERLKRENAGHGPVRTAECAVFGAEETVSLAKAQETGEVAATLESHLPAEVQIVRVGGTHLVGFPCETFVEYGLQLRREAKAPAYHVTLVNGELQGYIVTPEAAAAGGYEATNSLFDPEAGTIMVNAALSRIPLENA